MGTTVMFAAVGSSSDMACCVIRALLLWASSDELVARRNSPTLPLPSQDWSLAKVPWVESVSGLICGD
jgi:hypothetical protein